MRNFAQNDIIIIGPIKAGKSTVGKILAEKLGFCQCSLDCRMAEYLRINGFNIATYDKIYRTNGHFEARKYMRRFYLPSIIMLLQNCSENSVIDFGAGHSVYEDELSFEKIKTLLLPYQNIVLLLPSPNKDESNFILKDRISKSKWTNNNLKMINLELNEKFIRNKSNYLLAKFTVFNRNETPVQTANTILRLLKIGY